MEGARFPLLGSALQRPPFWLSSSGAPPCGVRSLPSWGYAHLEPIPFWMRGTWNPLSYSSQAGFLTSLPRSLWRVDHLTSVYISGPEEWPRNLVCKDVDGSWVLDPRMSIFTRVSPSWCWMELGMKEKRISPGASIGTLTLVPENLRRKLISAGQGAPSWQSMYHKVCLG